MRRNVFVVLLALLLVTITSSQIFAASAWYVINDNGAVKYAQDPAAIDYQSGKWSGAVSTADSLANFFAKTVQADDRVYMRADEFTIANPVAITKNLTVYGGFKDSDSSIDSRTGTTTIKGVENFKGSIITSNSGNILLDGLTITGGNHNEGGSTFENAGGGVHHGSGTLTITNCIITGNTAKFGGGVFNYDTMTMTNCTVSGNKATNAGGGIYNRAIQTITNCVISGNTAEIGGGGIDSDNDLTMTNCTVSGNSSFHGGGVDSHGFVMTMTNCTISDNKANHLGGGVYNTGEKLTIINCTVIGNSGSPGSEIANDWGLTIKNSLVWDGSGEAVYNYDGTKAWINASYCAFPSGLNVTGIKFDDDNSRNIAITSWNTRAVHEAEVDGVTHKVFEIETNQELASLEGAGTSDGAPDKDQIGRMRSNPPCIGAADTGKIYAPALDTETLAIDAIEGKSITAQTVRATQGSDITWSMSGTLPAGLTGAASESSTSYTISGTLEMGTTGSYSYTLTARNSAGEASTVININVNEKVALDPDSMTEPETNQTLREYLSDYSSEKLKALTDFKVPAKITSLEGIDEIMPKLKTLDLTAADSLSKNLDLRVLGNLQLEKVILSGNPEVKTLNIKSCDVQIVNAESCKNLGSIEVAGNEFIEEFYVGSTDITEMNARGCKNLKILHFPNANVKEIDLTGCGELRDLDFHNNKVRSFNKEQFGLTKLEKLDASGQREEVDAFKLIFDLMQFILGGKTKNNNNGGSASAVLAIDSAVSSGDKNLIDIEAYDESGNYIAYDDSDYARLGEIIFDAIPEMIIYYYNTGVDNSSMDMTISLALDYEDYEEFWGGSSSGGCDSGFASGALLALAGLAFILRIKH
ncbi:MAG: hypothetical protein IJT58_01580 [Synergistaceae bacterium]|nr:hypothetical protein [Synergistaceae bacterium]